MSTSRVEAGEVHALMGENGAGKSTLIKIMTGAMQRDAGEIRLDGEPIHIGSPGDARALGIGAVYQEVNLVPTMSVTKNLTLGRQPRRFGLVDWRQAQRARARAAETPRIARDRRRAPARLLFGRHPAARGDRPRARGRHARAGARRADREPRRPRDRSCCSRSCAISRRAASPSSSSPISSTRSTRSPTASRCCATAASSAPRRSPSSRRSSSSR